MWSQLIMGNRTRALAFSMVAGTVIGSVAPEFGNLAAISLDLPAHHFNIHFLIVGLVGIVGCGMALLVRFGVILRDGR